MALSLNIAMFQCSLLYSIVHMIILPVSDTFVLFLCKFLSVLFHTPIVLSLNIAMFQWSLLVSIVPVIILPVYQILLCSFLYKFLSVLFHTPIVLSLNIAMFQWSLLVSIVPVIILPVPDSFVLFLVQISVCATSYTFCPVIEYHNVSVSVLYWWALFTWSTIFAISQRRSALKDGFRSMGLIAAK